MKRENLIKARKNKKLTQKHLAEQLNISTRHYRGIELGDRSPSIKTALRLSEILGVTVNELFPKQP